MAIFYEYLQGYEREMAIEEAKFDTMFSKLDMMYEMVDLQLNQMYKDAELKVLTESGTYDDYTYLLTEAEKEVGEQKQGIISRIVTAISNFFKNISKKFKNLFKDSGDDDKEVEAPSNTLDVGKKLAEAIDAASNGLQKAKSGRFADVLKALKLIAIPAVVVGGGAVALKRFKKKDLKKSSDNVEKSHSRLMRVWDSIVPDFLKPKKDNKEEDDSKESTSIIQKIAKAVSDFCGSIAKALSGKGSEQNADGQNGNDQKGDGTKNKDEQNSDNQNGKKTSEPILGVYEDPKGNKYRKTKTGMIQKQIIEKDADGNITKTWWKGDPNPDESLRNAKFENSDDYIFKLFKYDITFERVGDYIYMEDDAEPINESASKRYIFGYDASDEEDYTESTYDAWDDELDELSALFSSL